jgi:hypothetical protein
MQIDETRAGETRSEVVAAGADAFEKPPPAFALRGGELRVDLGLVVPAIIRANLLAFVHGAAPGVDLGHIPRLATGRAVMT